MEKWRDIVGYEGMYQVSNLGRVKSLARVVPGPSFEDGIMVPHYLKEKILKDNLDAMGYPRCTLYSPNGNRRARVHVLVAEAFLPNPENFPLVRHLNDTKSDNRACNLAWGSYADNSADAKRNGRNPRWSLTHCKRGHEFTDENTYHTKDGRSCRKCRQEIHNARRRERRQAARVKG